MPGQVQKIIINTSPLLALIKSQQVQFLPQLFQEILLPTAVWQEIMAKPDDVAAIRLQELDWVKRIDNILVIQTVKAWDLGKGESEVISLAQQRSGYGVVIDDRSARNCAKTLNIPTLGTGAILILAKQVGLINQIKPGIQALQEAGLYLSSNLVDILLSQAGES
jgi:predicted nucleic acid-binding protein